MRKCEIKVRKTCLDVTAEQASLPTRISKICRIIAIRYEARRKCKANIERTLSMVGYTL